MGIIIGVGGGRYCDNEVLPIFEHIVSLAKKKNPSVLFVPTAGFDDINGDEHIFRLFIGLGCSVSALLLTDKTLTKEEIEEKILVYVNEERSKLGLAPVAYEHRADYFTHLRAVECFEFFEHERPDGRQWHTAYYDEGVYIERAGENLVYTTSLYEIYGSDFDIARYFVDSWMESPGHRSAILNPNFTSMSASVIIQDGEYIAVQHFFGPNSL